MEINEVLLKTGETRVWRTYGGGAALDRWHGREGKNGMFPEDWAASTTRARNPGREEIVEGLSRVTSMDGAPYLTDVIARDPQAFFGRAHLQAFGAKAGFLVKLIDAGERLTIQVHPDKRFAREILHSDYGKTESWYILGSNDEDKQPCIYLGFKPGVTRAMWKDIFERQDIPAMLDTLLVAEERGGNNLQLRMLCAPSWSRPRACGFMKTSAIRAWAMRRCSTASITTASRLTRRLKDGAANRSACAGRKADASIR